MSIFQCVKCGCAENTACGWYHSRNSERVTPKEFLGKALCSACAPKSYTSGEPTKFNGIWHGRFDQTFLPMNSCFTNQQGNLEHAETGLIGNTLYEKFGRSKSYKFNLLK